MSTILDALRRVEGEEGKPEPQPALDGDLLGTAPEAGAARAADATRAARADPASDPEEAVTPPTGPAPHRDDPRPAGRGAYPEAISIWPWAMAVAVGVLLIASGSWLLAAREPSTAAGAELPASSVPAVAVAESSDLGAGAEPDGVRSGTDAVAADPDFAPAADDGSARFAQARLREAIGADVADASDTGTAITPSPPEATRSQVALAAEPAPTPPRTPVAPRTAAAASAAPSEPPAAERVGDVAAAVREPAEPAPVPAKPAAEATVTARRPAAPATLPPAEVEVLAAPPEIRIARTRWHPKPERRTAEVEIDGTAHELHEGDQVETLSVAEIRPSAVIFVHAGIRLERKMGTR